MSRPKLTENQQRELCTLIATRMPPMDIVAYFKEKHDRDVSFQLIYHYRTSKKWSELISEERTKFDLGVSESFLACKRNRLDALERARRAAMEKGDHRAAVMAIAQAQKEMEGSQLRLTDKDGEDFQFNINIGPPPEEQKPKQVGPVLTLISPSKEDDEVD